MSLAVTPQAQAPIHMAVLVPADASAVVLDAADALSGLDVSNALRPAPERATTEDANELLEVTFPAFGGDLTVEVHPGGVAPLLMERYCGGGWAAVREFLQALLSAATKLPVAGIPGGRVPLVGVPGSRIQPKPHPLAPKFLRAAGEAHAQLEIAVSQTVVDLARTLLERSGKRLAELRTEVASQKRSFSLDLPPAPGGAHGGPGKSAAGDYPDVVVVNPAAAPMVASLLAAVRRLLAADRKLGDAIAARRATPTGISGAGGAPGGDSADKVDPALSGEFDARIAAAEDAFVMACNEVATAHPIAPFIFARARVAERELTDGLLQSLTYAWLRDAEQAIPGMLPTEYPFERLASRLRLSTRAANVEAGAEDEYVELRAALWAREHVARGYAYEPLDDEALLLSLLTEEYKRWHTEQSEEQLRIALRVRVLQGMIEARDRQATLVTEREAARWVNLEGLQKLGTFVDLVAILLPPLNPLARGLDVVALAGHVIRLCDSVGRSQADNDTRQLGALMGGDSARYAQLLADRPTIAEALSTLALQMGLAFGVMHGVSGLVGKIGGKIFFKIDPMTLNRRSALAVQFAVDAGQLLSDAAD